MIRYEGLKLRRHETSRAYQNAFQTLPVKSSSFIVFKYCFKFGLFSIQSNEFDSFYGIETMVIKNFKIRS